MTMRSVAVPGDTGRSAERFQFGRAAVLATVAAIFAVGEVANAASAVWNDGASGTAPNNWQTSGNWSASPFPGTPGSVFTTTDDATFSTAGSGTIDAGGALNIRTIIFGSSGGNAAAFTVGDANDTLNLTTAGGVTMNSGVTTSQNIGVAGTTINLSTDSAATAIFTNNGTGLLTIGGNVVGNAVTGPSTLTVAGTGNTTISGSISSASGAGATALTKSGTGTLMLSGTNGFAGTTTISGGTVQYNGASSLSGNSTLVLNSGATLALRSDAAATFTPAVSATSPITTTIASGATVNINVDQLASGTSGTILTLGGTTLVNGNNTLNVAGNNGYILRIAAIGSQGSGNTHVFNVASGNTLQMGNMTAGTGANEVNGKYRFTGAGNTLVDGNITMATANRGIGLVFDQTGTVTLSGSATNLRNNTNNGTDQNIQLNSGTVNFNNAAAVRSTQPVTFNIAGGVVDNTSGAAITLARSGTTNLNGDFSYAGTNDLNLGTNAYTLGTTAGSTRSITTNGTATLTIGGIISNGTNATTPTTGLTKLGSGTLKLDAANGFTGATTIQNGSVTLGSAGTISSNLVLGVSGGTTGTLNVTAKTAYSQANISGNGLINIGTGNTVSLTGTLAPGFSTGEVDVTGNLGLGSSTTMELASTGGIKGASSDYVNVSGALTYAGLLSVANYGGFDVAAQSGTYDLFDFASSSGLFSSVTVNGVTLSQTAGVWTGNSGSVNYSFDQSNGVLTVAVPEPASLAMLAVGGLLVAGRRRRA